MWDRIEIKQRAKAVVASGYWKNVLAALVLAIVTGEMVLSLRWDWHDIRGLVGGMFHIFAALAGFMAGFTIIGIVLDIFILRPLEVGGKRYFIGALRENHQIGDLGFSFDNCYLNIIKTMFLRDLFTWLWTLLFIIPGIIKSYEYRMMPYIMAENPSLSTEEVFMLSQQMMMGNKWRAFVFDLSFIGWFLLSFITFGIVQVFYVGPYYYLACAGLYEEISYDFKENP